jgi:hypothetical protein
MSKRPRAAGVETVAPPSSAPPQPRSRRGGGTSNANVGMAFTLADFADDGADDGEGEEGWEVEVGEGEGEGEEDPEPWDDGIILRVSLCSLAT